jgi:hypothetical protein
VRSNGDELTRRRPPPPRTFTASPALRRGHSEKGFPAEAQPVGIEPGKINDHAGKAGDDAEHAMRRVLGQGSSPDGSPKSSARLTRGESRAAVSNRHRDTNGTADHLAHWRDEYRVGQCRQPVPTRPRHDGNAVLRLSGFAAKRVLTTVFRHAACGSSAPDGVPRRAPQRIN